MPADRDEILDGALKLPDFDRLLIAERLLETVPEDVTGLSLDDPNFVEEVTRRFHDSGETIAVSDLWKRD